MSVSLPLSYISERHYLDEARRGPKEEKVYTDTDTLRYFNSTFVNNINFNQSITSQLQLTFVTAALSETRTSPIIKNPSDWLMSIIRFDVDARAIPIFFPQMQFDVTTKLPSTTITQSVVTLSNNMSTSTEPVIYVSSINNPTPYTTPSIYNYQDWLDLINTALATAYSNLTGTSGSPPIFIYDASTQLINLYIDQQYVPSIAGANVIKINMNVILQRYFANFQTIIDNSGIYYQFYNSQFDITDNNIKPLPAVGSRQGLPYSIQTIPNLYVCQQTAPGTSLWTGLRSVLLTSSSIPFKTEFVTTNVSQANNYLSNSLFPIVSDFLVPIDNTPTNQRAVLEYLPTAQYRYVDLTGESPLYRMDFKFYWSDWLGNVYPIFLSENGSVSIKVLFQKRHSVIEK